MGNYKIKSIEEFYVRYGNDIRRYISEKINSELIAEELIQDVIISYINDSKNRYKTFEPPTKSDFIERCIKQVAVYKTGDFVSFDDVICINEPSVHIIEKENLNELLMYFNKLKPIYKLVLICYYEEGMTIKEISELYEIKRDTVAKRIHRGRVQLLKILRRKGYRI